MNQNSKQPTYSVFHIHSFFSNLDGFSSPEENCKRAKELGLRMIGISDHGNANGHADMVYHAKSVGIPYCLGIELYVTYEPAYLKENRFNGHQVVWAKNKNGLKSLWRLTGQSNHVDYFYYRPRIQLKNILDPNGKLFYGIEEFCKDNNLFSFAGHQGSTIEQLLWMNLEDPPEKRREDLKKAYKLSKNIKDPEYYRRFLREDWLEAACKQALENEKVFGKDHFFIEIQNEFDENDELPFWNHILIAECMRRVAKETGIKPLASSDPHYAYQEEAEDQRILLMTNMRTNEKDVRQRLDDPEEHDSMGFFSSRSFYIKSPQEMSEKFTQEELDNTNWVADQIEQYSLENKARLPVFDIPDFQEIVYKNAKIRSDSYLLRLCVDGLSNKKPWEKTDKSKKEYWERLKTELDIIFSVGLSDYFLMVQDICQYAKYAPKNRDNFDWQTNLLNGGKVNPIVMGVGRGSSAGCLISYATNITKIDPLQYNLLFSRFYNHGRNKGNYISFPDCDVDCQSSQRDYIIKYLKWKYKNVSSIITFQYLKGRNSLKDTFRVKSSKLSQEQINKICDCVGIESKIIAEIEEMKKEDEDFNILKWTLLNSEEFQKYYEDPHIKEVVDQGIRCEGVIRGQGKHASGILIYPDSIQDHFPTCYDAKTKEQIAAVSMSNLEKLGGIKIDLLGVSVLDKLKLCQDLVNK